ncbi:MAG: asparaginase domain-containing protein [Akkermansiaceae bacterium]
MERLLILTTGGTIDKIYFDAKSDYEVGESVIPVLLRESGVTLDCRVASLMRKDSLDLTAADRATIRTACEEAAEDWIVITHGTDTMAVTAEAMLGIEGKCIVLTGSLAPARFRETDAVYNIGFAMAAAQSKPPGVYIAMNGQIFEGGKVLKNPTTKQFEKQL